jgi:hypothetical protein
VVGAGAADVVGAGAADVVGAGAVDEDGVLEPPPQAASNTAAEMPAVATTRFLTVRPRGVLRRAVVELSIRIPSLVDRPLKKGLIPSCIAATT